MILAMDVLYNDTLDTAKAAGVLFSDWRDLKPLYEICIPIQGIYPYEPGAFYKRELPCLMPLIREAAKIGPIDCLIVDGYVDMGPDHPGLGRRLYAALGGNLPVVGVAKTSYVGAPSIPVCRGTSKNPLYVSAAGMSSQDAAHCIEKMHGPHRIPTLLKWVDSLTRSG